MTYYSDTGILKDTYNEYVINRLATISASALIVGELCKNKEIIVLVLKKCVFKSFMLGEEIIEYRIKNLEIPPYNLWTCSENELKFL